MLIYHILVKYEYEANDLLKKIKSFEDLKSMAQKHSICSSANQKGFLGPLKKGRFIDAFEEAVEDLNENQISKPVRTNFGWHIIYKTSAKPED